LQSMKSRFRGEMVAMVKSAAAAETCRELKLRAIRIGDDATPTWAEVILK
jgi:hypothetical protein